MQQRKKANCFTDGFCRKLWCCIYVLGVLNVLLNQQLYERLVLLPGKGLLPFR
jgi:hypothetical protein